ncbi:hypothetical protein [Candidatus Palauibacter sp.]|uniref:hypothetical protein n=1 Tax=Candidatus Palauibacter sp. TaxID=3101350 RepID=UPI003B0280C9
MTRSDDMIRVFEAWDESEFLAARLALEAHDIPFRVEGEFAQVSWGPTAAAKILRVPASRHGEAKQVLRDSLRES